MVDPLKTVGGNIFDVTGTVSFFGTNPVHQIVPTAIVRKSVGTPLTPMVMTNLAAFAASGAGYLGYESMLVSMTPSAPFNVSELTFGDFDGGGAHFGADYRSVYARSSPSPGASSRRSPASPAPTSTARPLGDRLAEAAGCGVLAQACCTGRTCDAAMVCAGGGAGCPHGARTGQPCCTTTTACTAFGCCTAGNTCAANGASCGGAMTCSAGVCQ